MGTSVEELRRWFEEGVKDGATHMVVVCDTFDYEDYPVYVKPDGDVKAVVREFDGKDMQQVIEVYDLKKSADEQLKPGTRVFNY